MLSDALFEPRLGEGGSPERACLAWARPFSLSEGFGRGSVVVGRVFAFLWLELLGYDCHDEIYVHMYVYMPNELIYICMTWFINDE